MTEKRLTVILYGCDRNLWRGGELKIRVTDLFASGGPRVLNEGETEESTIELHLQLPFDAGQMYGLTFSAPNHRPAWHVLRRQDFLRTKEQIEVDDVVLRLMLVPDSAGTSDLVHGFARLQEIASPFVTSNEGITAGTFDGLDVAARMACLNIEAKLRETVLGGAPLLSFVRGVREVAVDRLFLFFEAGLKAQMPRASEFASAAGHGAPKDGDLPAHPDSWKHTRFAEGNVQLSFSREAIPLPDTDPPVMVHSADVDIDLGRGLAHAKEWLVNNVFKPGHKTNQALVYGLLYAQGILPRYTLDPAAGTTSRAITRLRTIAPPAKRRRAAAKRERAKGQGTKRATTKAASTKKGVRRSPSRQPAGRRQTPRRQTRRTLNQGD